MLGAGSMKVATGNRTQVGPPASVPHAEGQKKRSQRHTDKGLPLTTENYAAPPCIVLFAAPSANGARRCRGPINRQERPISRSRKRLMTCLRPGVTIGGRTGHTLRLMKVALRFGLLELLSRKPRDQGRHWLGARGSVQQLGRAWALISRTTRIS